MGGEAEGHILEGNALYARGEVRGAIERYRAALVVQPRNARALYNLGVALHGLGEVEEAAAHYARAVEAQPEFPGALVNWGNALRELGDVEGARQRYEGALALDPHDPHASRNLAVLHYQLARGRHDLRDWEGAFAHYARALELQPDLGMALAGWADTLAHAGDRDGAARLYRRLLEIDPVHAEALNNLASFALDAGRVEEARGLFERAAAAHPDMVEPRYNLALIALRRHDFARGWEGYELRLRADAATLGLSPTDLPTLARVERGSAGRLAVRKEQGIGDQILFSTLLPELAARGIDAVVEADPRLVECYRRSLPGIAFVTPEEAALGFASCAHQLPLGSLPRFFRATRESFAAQPKALLRPDAVRAEATRSALPRGLKVAISWRSFQRGRHRLIAAAKSAPLEAFAALAAAGVALVDLQYGDVDEERRAFDERHRGLRVAVEGLDLYSDIEGVLAAIEACDRVITTSNVTAHFAGAIGKPTWLVYLAANAPFHYWVPGADGRCLWYPSVEIVTDERWTDWREAFAAVAARFSGGA